MDIGSLIQKIKNRAGSRDLYDVPIGLCSGYISLDALADEAENAGVVNQLGVVVDLTLEYLIAPSHPRYGSLQKFSESLYEKRDVGLRSFYPYQNPRVTEVKKRLMHRLNEPKMYEILMKWDMIAVLSPDKFKQVFTQELERK